MLVSGIVLAYSLPDIRQSGVAGFLIMTAIATTVMVIFRAMMLASIREWQKQDAIFVNIEKARADQAAAHWLRLFVSQPEWSMQPIDSELIRAGLRGLARNAQRCSEDNSRARRVLYEGGIALSEEREAKREEELNAYWKKAYSEFWGTRNALLQAKHPNLAWVEKIDAWRKALDDRINPGD